MLFSVLAGIIPLSLQNGGGAFDTVCHPLSASGGGEQLSAAYEHLYHQNRRVGAYSGYHYT